MLATWLSLIELLPRDLGVFALLLPINCQTEPKYTAITGKNEKYKT